jgi:hypothetical protein
MNLTSCENCAVVLDKDHLNFPEDIWTPDGCIDDTKATWDGDGFVPFVKCPVCQEKITEGL